MHIYILPINFSEKNLLDSLSDALKDAFKLPVSILNQYFSLEGGRDPVRNQYNSTWILSQILKIAPDESCKVLGVTSVDLYIQVLTYVFGEAQLVGKAAVVSAYRLRNELYGLPKNPQRLKERLVKEAIHELGHTFGIIHCREPECIMYSTTYAEEIDFKSKNFCKACSSRLEEGKKKTNLDT